MTKVRPEYDGSKYAMFHKDCLLKGLIPVEDIILIEK